QVMRPHDVRALVPFVRVLADPPDDDEAQHAQEERHVGQARAMTPHEPQDAAEYPHDGVHRDRAQDTDVPGHGGFRDTLGSGFGRCCTPTHHSSQFHPGRGGGTVYRSILRPFFWAGVFEDLIMKSWHMAAHVFVVIAAAATCNSLTRL